MQAGKFSQEEHTRCISRRTAFHLQFFHMACWVLIRVQEVIFFKYYPGVPQEQEGKDLTGGHSRYHSNRNSSTDFQGIYWTQK